MAKHLHANNDDFARCYYDDPTTVHLVISDPDEYFGQVHKVFDVPRATHNAPGRHRWDWEDSLDNNPIAVYQITGDMYPDDRIGKFECPRRWVDGIAVEFEYLQVIMDNFGNGGFAWMVYFHLPCWTGDYKWARKHIDTFKD